MKIFIDFDKVLFDTTNFKKEMINICYEHGVSEKEFIKTANNFSATSKHNGPPYSMDNHIKLMEKLKAKKLPELKKALEDLMENLEEYVFSDVEKFLLSFRKDDLFLLSYGDVSFQKQKVFSSGMNKFFKNIIISGEHKIDIISNMAKENNIIGQEDLILIDDKPENLEKAENIDRDIKTFFMKRPGGKYSGLSCEHADFEVENLDEVKKIIKSEKMK